MQHAYAWDRLAEIGGDAEGLDGPPGKTGMSATVRSAA